MAFIDAFLKVLPEVKSPDVQKVSFSKKFKWTLMILVGYFLLGLVPLSGLGQSALQQFTFYSIILGAEFGSIISLGIGPIVTASIILQLLNGAQIVNFDLTTTEGKKRFQGWQKLLSIAFIIFQSIIFVVSGGLAPDVGVSPAWLIIQLMVGGYLIMLMDEVVSKWGFGSGLSLFIAAGVSKQLMSAFLSPFTIDGSLAFPIVADVAPFGRIWAIIFDAITQNFGGITTAFGEIAATVIVFGIALYAVAMKVEIPLSFGRARGFGMRWPLNFIYTSNIPVILIAALVANVQLGVQLLNARGIEALGTFSQGSSSGIVSWFVPVNLLQAIISGSVEPILLAKAVFYVVFFMLGSMVFSLFWVQTAGMDAKSLARQIMSSGLQVPGFRRDPRVLEKLLNRYIGPLAVMGGLAIGFLASVADLMGALTSGTGLLLALMIIYQLYQEIAKQHQMDMHPMMKKFVDMN